MSPSSSSSPKETSTVILGAGIIGVATAYYLSLPTHEGQEERGKGQIHLVENAGEVFASASGKAGGFLAEDWFSPPSASLGALSFKLHRELADKHGGREKWGYSPSTGSSYAETPPPVVNGRKKRGDDWLRNGSSRAEVAGQSRGELDAVHDFTSGKGPAWLKRRSGDEYETIGADKTVAQVDPLKLSQWLLEKCKQQGVQLHQPAEAISLVKDTKDRIEGVRVRKTGGTAEGANVEVSVLPCTNLVLASGAWTPRVFKTLFPSSTLQIPISSLAGHSLVLRSPHWTPSHEQKGCHAVFSTASSGFSPEIFSRIGGEIYVGGLNSSTIPLPRVATEAEIDPQAVEQLKETGRRMLGLDGEKEGGMESRVEREGLCFRPVTERGEPIVCRLDEEKVGEVAGVDGQGGVFVAAGHGPWGISLSLGTGRVMADMISGRKTSCDVSELGM